MNRREIQKAFEQLIPPTREKQIRWFAKIANKLHWSTERVQSLWKDERCKISYEEGLQLRNALRISPQSEAKTKRRTENDRDLQEIAEIKKELKNEIMGEFGEAFSKAFANAWQAMAR